ncbi:gephyrin-like molybdotransferase Glp [Paraburkholderia domus]|nr:gephyrin-like molybdotransferase Glp [Paraburkholderia domus]MBK5050344.1 molybdopterin molybdotransferase MoeA [Burkholderia sp. R-70006]MBK5062304.1 molybdopterin molybdotransferase MoeA [Burkholderia sp. R-70199]MBK5087956.1 molybdopterin molybdotransferase MoeA [Burkholderia sp. R-69927]MBK5120812.1 molybdopterin molybdotransferase MoeA [Burkholderia sp. R-69980]MBK5167058.1 molybdopterin molybdotransferase MoeA [Burkholderia sp. R-70211]MBK5181502.1 molybdopterin molybdotransferase Mo
MLSTAEALATLLSAASPITGTESIPTLDALNRVLSADVISPLDVPPMNTSSMDGYAIHADDLATNGNRRLPVSQRIPAGHAPEPLKPGTAARIFTGATVPRGADAIVMQEQTEAAGNEVTILHSPAPGEWITAQGADIRSGSVILPAGTRLTPQALGLAASVGCAELQVRRRVKVAVFFTGDELTMPGEPLKPGAIYNSNRFTLRGLLEKLGCDVTDYGIVPDKLDATRATLREAAQAHDLILTCGGVSVGEEDHVKPAVEAEGRLSMWQIAMKPGKPLAFGAVRRAAQQTDAAPSAETFFIGLPGNPVSSFATFLLFVRPFVLLLAGMRTVAPRALSLRADFTQKKADRRNEFLRARINAAGGLDLFPNQSSAVLTSTVWGDGLIDNPPNHAISVGETVRFIPFSELLN